MAIPSPSHFPRRLGIVSSEFLMLVGVDLRFIKLKGALLLNSSCATHIAFFQVAFHSSKWTESFACCLVSFPDIWGTSS